MSNSKKSGKIKLVSFVAILCSIAIAVGCVLLYKKQKEVEDKPVVLSWSERVDLLGTELKNANSSVCQAEILETSVPFRSKLLQGGDYLSKATSKYFVIKNNDVGSEKFYLYRNGEVVDVADLDEFGEGSVSVLAYSGNYVAVKTTISDAQTETTNEVLKVLDFSEFSNPRIGTYKVVGTFDVGANGLDGEISNFDFSSSNLSAKFYVKKTISFAVSEEDETPNIDSVTLVYVNLKTGEFLKLETFEWNYNSDTVTIKNFDNFVVISKNRDVLVYYINGNSAVSKQLELGEKTEFSVVTGLSENRLAVETKKDVSENPSETSVKNQFENRSGIVETYYYDYEYYYFDFDETTLNQTKAELGENVSKLELEKVSDSFYLVRERNVDEENNLTSSMKNLCYYKDNGLVLEFAGESTNENIVNAKSKKVLTSAKLMRFEDATTSENLVLFSEESAFVNTKEITDEFYVAFLDENNERYMKLYSFNEDFDAEEQTEIRFVFGEYSSKFEPDGIFTDGKNYYFTEGENTYKFDRENNTFSMVPNFYYDEYFSFLTKNGLPFYLVENSYGMLELRNLDGTAVYGFDNISAVDFEQDVDSGILINFVSNGEKKQIKFDAKFTYNNMKDSVEQSKNVEAQALSRGNNGADKYTNTVTITYYYNYTSTKKDVQSYDDWNFWNFGNWIRTVNILNFMGSDQGNGWSFVGWARDDDYKTTIDYGGGTSFTEFNNGSWSMSLYAVYNRTVYVNVSWGSTSMSSNQRSWIQAAGDWHHNVTSYAITDLGENATSNLSYWSYYGYGYNSSSSSTPSTSWTGTDSMSPGFKKSNSGIWKTYNRTITLVHSGYYYSSENVGISGSTSNVDRTYYFVYASGRVYSSISSSSNGYSRVGYTFYRWGVNGTSTTVNASTSFKPPVYVETESSTVNMYARWTANKYYIQLAGNSGTLSSQSGMSWNSSYSRYTATYDSQGTFYVYAQRTGYLFNGWTLSAVSGTSLSSSYTLSCTPNTANDTTTSRKQTTTVKNLTPTKNGTVTLTAKWTPITYYIQLEGNGGTLSSQSGLSWNGSKYVATYDTTGTFYVSTQRNGYQFNGWSRSPEAGTSTCTPVKDDNTLNSKQQTTTALNLTTTNGATITFTAQWTVITYNVTIAPNGGSAETTSYSCTYDATNFTVKIKKTGYHLSSWSVSGTGRTITSYTGSITSNAETTSYSTANVATNLCTYNGATITLTANWTAIQYTVTLNSVSSTGEVLGSPSATSGCSVQNSSSRIFKLTYDTQAIFTNSIKRTGYHFVKWTVAGTSATLSEVTKTNNNGNSVAFNLDNVSTNAITITTNGKNMTTNTAGVTLTAVWTPIVYNISYNKNKPQKATSEVLYNGDQNANIPNTTATYDATNTVTSNVYTLKGWTFGGWKSPTNATYASGATFTYNYTSTNSATIVFNAIWTQNKYNIVINENRGTISALTNVENLTLSNKTFTATYDETGVFTNNIVRDGYMFSGWEVVDNNSSDTGTVSVSTSGYSTFNAYYTANTNTVNAISLSTSVKNLNSMASGGTVTLKAIWTPITYYVTLNKGATSASEISYPNDTNVQNISYSSKYTLNYLDPNDSSQVAKFKVSVKRTGYYFKSWSSSTTLGSVSASFESSNDSAVYHSGTTTIKNLTKTHLSTVTLTINWERITYRVKLVAGHSNASFTNIATLSNMTLASSSSTATYNYEIGYDVTGTFTVETKRNGWKFTSWDYTPTNPHSENIGSVVTPNPDSSDYTDIADYYDKKRETAENHKIKTTVYNLSTTKDAIVELTATWTKITYTVAYYPNKPSTSYYNVQWEVPNSSFAYDTSSYLQKNNFTLIGWTYLGWSRNASATTQSYLSEQNGTYNFTTVDKSTVNLYAIWRQNNYTINYILDNKDEAQPSGKVFTASTKFDNPAFEVSLPIKTGYTFLRYEIYNMSVGNEKLWCKSNATSVADNLLVNKLGNDVTTFTNSITNMDSFYKNLTSVDGGSVTFKAFWRKNTYNLTYNYSYGDPDPTGQYPAVATYDEEFYVTAPIRLGYTFTGWNLANLTGNCKHKIGDSYTDFNVTSYEKALANRFMNLCSTDLGTVTFTATWRANVYNISYDFSGGGGKKSGLTYADTMTFDSWSTVSNPYRVGYTFTSWIISGMSTTCDHQYKNSSKTYTTKSTSLTIDDLSITGFLNLHSEQGATITFVPTWIANQYNLRYIVSYTNDEGFYLDAIRGSGNYPETAVFDRSFYVDAPETAPFGYYFGGWLLIDMSTDCNHYYGTSDVDVNSNAHYATGSTYAASVENNYFKNLHSTKNATVIIKANWKPNEYNLNYVLQDKKGGDGQLLAEAPRVAYYNIKFTIPTPIRTGYTFTGWSLDDLSDDCSHYYYKPAEVKFESFNHGYYDVEHNNPETYIVVTYNTFMNLHCVRGATVKLIASWRANQYTIHYHYLSSSFDSAANFNDNTINVVIPNSAYEKVKDQSVTYDSLFTTFKMVKSDDDTTGVVVPANVSIVYWIFFTKEITNGSKYPTLPANGSGNYRIATLDEDKNPVPETKYVLSPNTEYIYSSNKLFGTQSNSEYPMFGQDVHAYAIYGYSTIRLKFYGTSEDVDFNNLAKYSHYANNDIYTSGNAYITLPSSIGGRQVLGYKISRNYYTYGELNTGSITTFKATGTQYTANAGASVKWGYPSTEAYDPQNPEFYLYAVYDCSNNTLYRAEVDNTNHCIKFYTSGMLSSGKTYKITIRGLASTNYFDYKYVKLARAHNSTGSNMVFDKIYSHYGIKSDSSYPSSNFSTSVNSSTSTMTITFKAGTGSNLCDLFLFYDSSLTLSATFIENVEILIMEVV